MTLALGISPNDFVEEGDPDRELILIFQSLTGCSVEVAKRFVGGPHQDLEAALSRYQNAKADLKAEPLVNRKASMNLPENLKADVPITLDLGRGSRSRSRTDASVLTLPKTGSTRESASAVSPPPSQSSAPPTDSRGAFVSSLPPLVPMSATRSTRSLDVTPHMVLTRPMSSNAETASHSDEPSMVYVPLSAQRRPSIRKLARSRDLNIEAAMSSSSPALLSNKSTPALNIVSSKQSPSAHNSPPALLSPLTVTSSSPTTSVRKAPPTGSMPVSPRRDRSVTSPMSSPRVSPVQPVSPRVSPVHAPAPYSPPASVSAFDRHSLSSAAAAATQSTLFVGDINLGVRAATEPIAGTLFTGNLDPQAVRTLASPASPRRVQAHIDVQAQMRAAASEPVRFAMPTPGMTAARGEYSQIVLPSAAPVRTTSAFAPTSAATPAHLEYVGLSMEPTHSNYSTPHVQQQQRQQQQQQQQHGYEPLHLAPARERT